MSDTGASGSHFVVVPSMPGRLIEVADQEQDRTRDDLDELIDDLFGESTDETPGLVDLALLLVGTGLLAWAVISGASVAWVVVGAAAVLLGLILPVRSLLLRLRRAGARRRWRTAFAQGVPLDVSHATTARPVRIYDDLLDALDRPGVASGRH